MILAGIDCTEQYEAMRRGEWPEPHPEVVAAHQALTLTVLTITEDDRVDREDQEDE